MQVKPDKVPGGSGGRKGEHLKAKREKGRNPEVPSRFQWHQGKAGPFTTLEGAEAKGTRNSLGMQTGVQKVLLGWTYGPKVNFDTDKSKMPFVMASI